MPAVFGASLSPNRVPYSEHWDRCISHQLNTAMKHGFDGFGDFNVRSDMENLKKKLIRILKNWS